MDGEVLERIYQENLEEKIISRFVQLQHTSYEDAMEKYYNSRLAGLIQNGSYDIQYLDYKILADLLCNELSAGNQVH